MQKKQTDARRQPGRAVAVRGAKDAPRSFFRTSRPASPTSGAASGADYWRWGDDNMLPAALAQMSRRSTTHRRIINDKADYISGKGFSFDPSIEMLARLVDRANGEGQSLREVFNRLAFDKALFGNAFLEVVTDPGRTFLSLHHQDASRCRASKDGGVLLHHDWTRYRPAEAVRLPLYPAFEETGGLLRAMIHYKDYEPMFGHYGVPSYIAGMGVTEIAYKTDRWNISRLDSSFQLSGVLMIDGVANSEADAIRALDLAEKKFAGKPGQVMFMVTSGGKGEDGTRFIPISSSSEGDWRALHDQATGDIVVAHSWFRSLSGLDYGAGFNAERILHEYEIALNTVILGEQAELLEPVRRVIEFVLGVDGASLQVVNRPPTKAKPLYMKVWEARKADGLDYDETDPAQQALLGQIMRYDMREVD
jgi:hypothetical protein